MLRRVGQTYFKNRRAVPLLFNTIRKHFVYFLLASLALAARPPPIRQPNAISKMACVSKQNFKKRRACVLLFNTNQNHLKQ